jgi:ABC-2 type transport system ATP-binding protein
MLPTVDRRLVVCDDVHYTARGGQHLLDGVSVTVAAGEVLGLVGPNGSGKTTVLRVMLGLLRPQSGRVLLFGEERVSVASMARVGAAIDPPVLYPWMTGRSALRTLLGIAGESDRGRSAEALAQFGLAGDGRKLVRRYSQGMRKRLALAAAAMRNPDVLVLDEPTNGLDPDGRDYVRSWIVAQRSRGVGIVIATHSAVEARDVCDRVVAMTAGKAREVSTEADLRSILEE